MDTAVVVAIISGIATIFATVLTVWAGMRKAAKNEEIARAVMETKLEELTREVREHNGFAKRLPVVENDIVTLYKRIEKMEANHD